MNEYSFCIGFCFAIGIARGTVGNETNWWMMFVPTMNEINWELKSLWHKIALMKERWRDKHAEKEFNIAPVQWNGRRQKKLIHDDVNKWKNFQVQITCSTSLAFGDQWIPCTKASDMELWLFSLICTWTNCWVNNHHAGDLRCQGAHYDVTVIRHGAITKRKILWWSNLQTRIIWH